MVLVHINRMVKIVKADSVRQWSSWNLRTGTLLMSV